MFFQNFNEFVLEILFHDMVDYGIESNPVLNCPVGTLLNGLAEFFYSFNIFITG